MSPTKISLIYDDLYLLLKSLLPNHAELINPYRPEDQDNLSLEKAYGVTILEGENTEKEIGSCLSISRDFELILTRKVFSGPIRTSGAMEKRKEVEKCLLEDNFIVAKRLQSQTYLKDSGFENLASVKYSSDSGLLFIRSEQTDLVMIRSIIEIEYFESLGGP